MDRDLITANLRRLTAAGLPAVATIAGRSVTVTPITRRSEDVASQYGMSATVAASLLVVSADLPFLPKTGDPVTLMGTRYRVLSCTSQDAISVLIDLEAWH